MAARENQGYLIAVIVLVLLSLILALLAFLGWSSANENSDLLTAANQKAALNGALADAQKAEADILKSYVGIDGYTVDTVGTLVSSFDRFKQAAGDGADQVEAVRARVIEVGEVYTKDMKINSAVGSEDAAQNQTWRATVANVASALRKKHNDIFIQNNELKRLQENADAEIAAKQAAMDELQKNLEATQTALAQQKQTAAKNEQELTGKLEQNQTNLQQVTSNFDNARQTTAKMKRDFESTIDEYVAENSSLKSKVNTYEKETFDLPDGKITKVSPGTVYVNLGYADGLRVNRSFAVYDSTVNNYEKGSHKAMIEIVNIVGDHAAEARVTLEEPTDPILTGDLILTATWDPGYSTPIALAGVFDLDADGFSDREKLMQMIERNGGNVVAYHDEDGNITGSLDSATRYLVMGPSPKEGIDYNANVAKSMQVLYEQAEQNTVQVIDLRKLLNWMGVHGRGRIERMDNRIGESFQPRSPAGN